MSNESAPAESLSPSPPTTITGSSSGQLEAASSPGSSQLCWAANLSAALTQLGTVYWLGLPLLATFTEAIKSKDMATMAISGLAFLAIVRSSSLSDIAKVLTAVKGLLPGNKA